MADTVVLYRPVGLHEFKLIRDSAMRRFPPRLPDQPIFYPVLVREYAVAIARDWNAADAASGYAGLVTEFRVDAGYAARFEPHTVGSRQEKELWVPADELDEFNANIVGPIRVTAAFYGDRCDERDVELDECFGDEST